MRLIATQPHSSVLFKPVYRFLSPTTSPIGKPNRYKYLLFYRKIFVLSFDFSNIDLRWAMLLLFVDFKETLRDTPSRHPPTSTDWYFRQVVAQCSHYVPRTLNRWNNTILPTKYIIPSRVAKTKRKSSLFAEFKLNSSCANRSNLIPPTVRHEDLSTIRGCINVN